MSLQLVQLLSKFLGPGKKSGSKHYHFKCPSCCHPKHKLAIQIQPNEHNKYPWQCWHCNEINKTAGQDIKSLLYKFKAPKEVSSDIYSLLNIKASNFNPDSVQRSNVVSLPKEFVPLYGFTPKTHYEERVYDTILTYLVEDRNLTMYDILKYNVGMCLNGAYSNMIIFPSYNEHGIINYFIGRTPHDKSSFKYKLPEADKTKLVPFENTINWKEPVILVEGVFDMITVKRNALPLLGKTITDQVMRKLLSEDVDKIYVCLDQDAKKNAVKHCERLISFGKEVYFVEMNDKDPNNIGFEKVNNIIQNTYPLSNTDIFQLKFSLLK